MRRTLTVLVTAAAFLVPASAASATDVVEVPGGHANASCSNGKGGNGAEYNLKGNTAKAAEKCGDGVVDPGPGNGGTEPPAGKAT